VGSLEGGGTKSTPSNPTSSIGAMRGLTGRGKSEFSKKADDSKNKLPKINKGDLYIMRARRRIRCKEECII